MVEYALTTPPGEAVIHETVLLHAPRELVWRAMTEADRFARWWGPRRYTNRVLAMNVRPGGKWRVEQRAPSGKVFTFFGEFIEIDAPRRMVQTFAFADYPPARIELVLEPEGPDTRLRSTMQFTAVEMRDGMIGSGMEQGAREGYERLEELLADELAK